MGKSEYFRDRHLMAVMDAARASGCKGAVLAVLSYMCSASAFKKPTVCVSKETICDRTGYGMKAVKAALADLRARGFLDPVACFEGGRNRSTIYAIKTKAGKGGGKDTANGADGLKGYPLDAKGVSFSPERGILSAPPSIPSSISSSRQGEMRGAGRATTPPHGGLSQGDAAGQGGQAVGQFDRDYRDFGLDVAMQRIRARQAARGGICAEDAQAEGAGL